MVEQTNNHESVNKFAFEMANISFAYNKSSPSLTFGSWQVKHGDRVFLSGASGSGKSTLLNLLAGTLSPSTGAITINGVNTSALSSRQRDRFRAQHIGVVFQQFNLIPYLSLRDNIQAAAYFANKLNPQLDQRIDTLFSQLKLDKGLLSRRADNLSVGQQQRVAIARALVNQPELIIADEPTSALDADAQASFMELLLSCCEQSDSTLVFVSHDKALQSYFNTQVDIHALKVAAI